mmetsp:Transcript_12509/g.20334  ORF Transcript_12509/g.20334 Transcript_12509/m.20334 type:complete len:220 (+) Transcript_12509:856-1515(+)
MFTNCQNMLWFDLVITNCFRIEQPHITTHIVVFVEGGHTVEGPLRTLATARHRKHLGVEQCHHSLLRQQELQRPLPVLLRKVLDLYVSPMVRTISIESAFVRHAANLGDFNMPPGNFLAHIFDTRSEQHLHLSTRLQLLRVVLSHLLQTTALVRQKFSQASICLFIPVFRVVLCLLYSWQYRGFIVFLGNLKLFLDVQVFSVQSGILSSQFCIVLLHRH